MLTVWFYKFKPGRTASTLDALRARGPERVYPGVETEGGGFLTRVWSHPLYTHASMFERPDIAAVREETRDRDNLLENLRILSPGIAAMEVRNLVPADDAELTALGDDGWHEQVTSHWIEAAHENAEIKQHLDVIGFSCLKEATFPPYMILELWRTDIGRPYKWFGGTALA